MYKNEKGNFGYIKNYKNKQAMWGFIFLALVLIIFTIGVIIYGDNKSIFTIFSAVLMLPTARFLVAYFVVFPYKTSDKDIYDVLTVDGKNGLWRNIDEDAITDISEDEEMPSEKCGPTIISDTIFTFNEYIMNIDFIAISEGDVIAYSDHKKINAEYTDKYIKKILDNSCNYRSFKFYTNKEQFLNAYKALSNTHSNKNAKLVTNDMIIARKLLPYSI